MGAATNQAGEPTNVALPTQPVAPEIDLSINEANNSANTAMPDPVAQTLAQMRDATRALGVSQGSQPSSLLPLHHVTPPSVLQAPVQTLQALAAPVVQAPVAQHAQLPNQGVMPDASNASTLHALRPNMQTVVRINLPQIDKWDGKCKTRRADTFLDDIERYAAMSMQDASNMLLFLLAPDIREQYEQVRKRYTGSMPWDVCRKEFKKMVGELYERTEENVSRAFINNEIKQLSDQSVAKYRTCFENQLRIARAMPEYMAVGYFINGLVPELQIRCLGDANGRSFNTLDDAFQYAQNEERKLRKEQAVQSKLKRNATAMLSDDRANVPRHMQNRKKRRMHGGYSNGNGNDHGNGGGNNNNYNNNYNNNNNNNNNNRGQSMNRGGFKGVRGFNKFQVSWWQRLQQLQQQQHQSQQQQQSQPSCREQYAGC
jgi:hypothetical protein